MSESKSCTQRKGIILAGGSGTRLHPLTRATSKQMLPVYDKPMIYYPLCVLMSAGIRDILIITTPRDHEAFSSLLGDGSQWGLNFQYASQPNPDGIGQAFIIGESFLNGSPCCLVLGDNIYFGHGLQELLIKADSRMHGATVFGYSVRDPERYGVVVFDKMGKAIELEEKPTKPISPYAVTGLYFYDAEVVKIAKSIAPSTRGELEITDINKIYLAAESLHVEVIGRGFAWLDAGTPESLLEAANFVQAVQGRQGQLICCPEEFAYRMGYIDAEQLLKLAAPLSKNHYGRYLRELLNESPFLI